MTKPPTRQDAKVRAVLHEFKLGKLSAGSPKGPKVTDRKQAVAIALRQAGAGRR